MEKDRGDPPEAAPGLVQAIARHRAGDLDGAIEAYQRERDRAPEDANVLNNLAIALKAKGRLDEAVETLRRAVELKPDNPHYRYNLGNALNAKGDAAGAEAAYRRVLDLAPSHRGAIANLGLILQERDDGAALALFARGVALGPERAEAWHNYGTALFRAEKWEAAIVAFRRALALDAGSAKTWCHLGLGLALLGQYEEAIGCHRQALERNAGLAAAHAGLGQAQVSLGRLTEGEASLRKALAIDTNNLDARLGLARTFLLAGEFIRGWPAYDWRWKRPRNAKRPFKQSEWDGLDDKPRTILLHAEQGLGDAIQFLRYVPVLAAQGHKVVLELPEPLIRLAATVEGASQVVKAGTPLPPFDCHIALLDLPKVLRTTVASVPKSVPYVAAPAPVEHPAPVGVQLRIGFAWSGNPVHSGDRLRSAPFSWFLALSDVPNTAWYSLQVGEARNDLTKAAVGAWIADLGVKFGDFQDTANAIAGLDLIVTVDTAVAHLAGAMGKPVWVALPFAPDWRWMLERQDSPWYPTLRLFRQPAPGDWAGVFKRMHDALIVAAKGWTRDPGPGKTNS